MHRCKYSFWFQPCRQQRWEVQKGLWSVTYSGEGFLLSTGISKSSLNQSALRRSLEYLSLWFEETSTAFSAGSAVQCACHQLVESPLIVHCAGLQCFGKVFSSTSWRRYNNYCKAGVTKHLTGTNKLEQERKKSKVPLCRKTGFFLFLSTMSLGVMATELLQYFMCCSNGSHKACITTACAMLHPALVTLPPLIFFHVRYSTSSLKLQRK